MSSATTCSQSEALAPEPTIAWSRIEGAGRPASTNAEWSLIPIRVSVPSNRNVSAIQCQQRSWVGAAGKRFDTIDVWLLES